MDGNGLRRFEFRACDLKRIYQFDRSRGVSGFPKRGRMFCGGVEGLIFRQPFDVVSDPSNEQDSAQREKLHPEKIEPQKMLVAASSELCRQTHDPSRL